MKRYILPHTDLAVSELIYGCIKIRGGWSAVPQNSI